MWVQNQTLIFDTWPSNDPSPNTPYPYARLASLNSTGVAATYVYHQLSGTVLCEDAYFQSSGWRTTNITITPSG